MEPAWWPVVRDVGQLAAWIAGILAALYGIVQSVDQRKKDRAWRQAQIAKELLTDIHLSPLARNAVMMLDWRNGRHEYDLPDGTRELIAYNTDVLPVLVRSQSEVFSRKDAFIWDCFDWFFYYIDRIQHAIDTGLIRTTDVESVLQPYAEILAEDWNTFHSFLRTHRYDLAKRLWLSYPALQGAQTGAADSKQIASASATP